MLPPASGPASETEHNLVRQTYAGRPPRTAFSTLSGHSVPPVHAGPAPRACAEDTFSTG